MKDADETLMREESHSPEAATMCNFVKKQNDMLIHGSHFYSL